MGIYSDFLLTVDFDRTLTGPDSTIPQRNLEAIRYFIENGGTFTVNTGRSLPMSMHNIIGKVPVNAPLLLYNGSADYDIATDRFTRSAPLPLDPAVVLTDLQNRFPALNVEVQGPSGHHLLRNDTGWERYCENNHCAYSYITPDTVPQPFFKFALNGQFRENTVASMYQATEEELALFQQAEDYIHCVYGDVVDTFRACARILDVHAKNCGKLNAARALQRSLGKKYLICVGDAENDLSMLEGADYAYCPADGTVADRFPNVCPCAQGAVADVIYEKIPKILKMQK
ncbi:MAG: HAD family phosphatase [Oscillospiraceae bacterium]|nr:HAD family phosphatase [Oscillospiraceae bacterium]